MRTLINWLNREKPPRQFPLSDFDRISHELRPCDVILVEGRSRISDIIRWLTNSPWTHAALYIGKIYDLEDEKLRELISRHYDGEPGDRLVIESLLGYGTIVRALSLYEREHLRICRPARLSHTDAGQVVRYAASQIGMGYDVRQIFDLARFLLPLYLLPKRWASTLFERTASRPAKTVCSTMIAEAFGYVNFPILPLVKHTDQGKPRLFRRNPRLCTPSDFDYSPYFEIIKYPFMDFYHEEYHLLPWKGPGMLTSEEADFYVDPKDTVSSETLDNSIAEAVASVRPTNGRQAQ
ncbi:MAG: hypothetical protein HOC70_06110 [Gammaproteobacteria bacterium]|jgi:hypothetical protein|nr:hypothetical protein [Gammaproteobacteria bacterium]MBT4492803.1 hypothetical protein [Gammaproteobacteria bacterium]MBT7369819.1 hypothetical protein [Gammaproteobacteria bacterium]